jgi:signal transduction histidine kinase
MADRTLTYNQLRNFSMLDLPIGIYMVAPNGHFIVCNRPVRKMFELPPDGPLEANITDYYAEPGERPMLLEKAIQADQNGKYLEKEGIHFRVKGRDLFVENYCRPLKDADTQEIIGYIGCLVDVTGDHENVRRSTELSQRVDELAFDIGRILHANTTTLVMVTQTLNNVMEALEPNPFENEVPTPEEIDRSLAEYAHGLANAIERFMQVADQERRLKAMPEARWRHLGEQVIFLREYEKRIPSIELRYPALRKLANEIVHLNKVVAPGAIPREAVRDLQQVAWQLERICNLIDVMNTRIAVIQMDYTLHSLREFVTADSRETEKRTRLQVKYLIGQTVNRLAEFAHTSNVEIKVSELVEAEVEVNEREVVRALANLLHNAIKYTWKRAQTKNSWVAIRTQIQERKVSFEFENWGVPIAREELEEERIFNLGYRGRLSTDRGRLGTGIGLTDARRVARAHGGDVQLKSRPSRAGGKESDPEYYTQPFITTAIFTIPAVGDPKSS